MCAEAFDMALLLKWMYSYIVASMSDRSWANKGVKFIPVHRFFRVSFIRDPRDIVHLRVWRWLYL